MLNYATNIALIDKMTNQITNIIWGYIYDMNIFENENILPVQCDDLCVGIGDFYIDGKFYDKDGNIVKNTSERMIEMHKALEVLGVKEQ